MVLWVYIRGYTERWVVLSFFKPNFFKFSSSKWKFERITKFPGGMPTPPEKRRPPCLYLYLRSGI